ncbi:glutamate-1-semialdehyde 2,1-aminomutase [Gimesia sp.]|uniref:glutamate-1-semialdehyde 2,1-aminomutase n=1 Tax=Gimesia sp. TaxID=2024833 RepID=UPI000C43D00D|nr:glutamate-1-semialdehyde 2,1-aminomutase [Gimesia sp.]MAX36677.1 glutamate-1-semialdehyde-2,1-aminomutase [Gimesia sp.]HBL42922.1 glutamate-1-semialdehyde-2,1-aminomutase [Planctomycetaceae bacterium]|tara:strand:- start:20783 stop:22078 length:1296 start_codon:yes stop_codon:yes gene_type:complete
MSVSQRTKSEEQFARALKVIPGGVNSPARAFGAVGGHPVMIDRGEGQYLYDIDGNRYIDLVGSWGPHILGHLHPRVMPRIEAALKKGTSFGAPTLVETELAELVAELVPCVEKVRMVNSGTEAGMSVIRLARGYTRRDKIIKFAGCYHGHVDSLLVQAGSGALTLGTPSSPGVPQGCTADTLVLEYNDIEQLKETFAQLGDQIAAVILEPVVGNMGVVLPEPGFLETVREVCSQHGSVFIMDEVMTGFRVALGGAQQRFNIMPDICMLGKVIGGGMPVGAYGGKAEIMDVISPVGNVYQAGTLSGNPIAMASGLATLECLRESNPYAELEAKTSRLTQGLRAAAAKADLPHTLAECGSMFTLFFNPEKVTSYAISAKNDAARFGRYFQGMLDRGVYLPCSQFEANFTSVMLTDEDIAHIIQAAEEVLQDIG